MPSARLLWLPTRKRLRAQGVLRRETEVGKRALAVVVLDDLYGLSVPYVDDVRSPRRQRIQFEPARLAAPPVVEKHEYTFVVKLAVLIHLGVNPLPGAQH